MSTMVIETRRVRGTRPPAGPAHDGSDSPPVDSAPSPGVRLTRRGRLVVVLAVLAMVYGLLTALSAPAASTGQIRHVPAHRVVVESGQTLWDIARAVAPASDPRDVVAEIVRLNSLPDPGSIRVGQPLDIPAQ